MKKITIVGLGNLLSQTYFFSESCFSYLAFNLLGCRASYCSPCYPELPGTVHDCHLVQALKNRVNNTNYHHHKITTIQNYIIIIPL